MNNDFIISPPIDPLVIGKLGISYGVRGWLRVFSFTEETISIFDYKPWFIQQGNKWQHLALEKWKYLKQDLIIKIKGINNRNVALQLTNYKIIVDAIQLPKLEEGEYYWKDLIGCEVINQLGHKMGKVINLIETGSNDVLVVNTDLKHLVSTKEKLIPFIMQKVIKKVDLSTGTILVDW